MLVSTMVLIPPYRTKFLRCYRKAGARSCGRNVPSATGPLAPKGGRALSGSWGTPGDLLPVPREHWRHLRTTNVVESPFAAVRLRTTAAKRFKKVDFATALIWKLWQVAEGTFRRINAPELLPGVYVGVRYVDGVKQRSTAPAQEVAA